MAQSTSTQQPTPRQVEYMDTKSAYDLWSKVYDSDGNILQLHDDQVIDATLPSLIPSKGTGKRFTILDLGCGTGRNTVKLVYPAVDIIAVDNSEGMMEKARERVESQSSSENDGRVDWIMHDLNDISGPSLAHKLPNGGQKVDAVVSTLVLEHIPLQLFFDTVKAILNPGGWFLLTNMHPDMGAISQAGFTDPETGKKVRPTSYNYSVEEIVKTAAGVGLVLRGNVMEREVRNEQYAEELGLRASKWVGVKMHLMIVFDFLA